jgi:DNA-binding PadR family transcriptional regulator
MSLRQSFKNTTRLWGAQRRGTLEKFVKSFLDLLILALVNDGSRCGYEILALIHERLGVLISPGTLYPLLHMLEERELIESRSCDRKKNYVLTQKGTELFTASAQDFQSISGLFVNMMNQSLLEGR